MSRAFVVWLACLALVSMSVTGAHGHWSAGPIESPAHGHAIDEEHVHHDSQLFLSLDSQHGDAHQHGDVDIDPPVKAFGKVGLDNVIGALWVALTVLALAVALRSLLNQVPPPLRPPKSRSRPYIFPPSHAPPHTA
jgi:hypothetical protein